MAESEVTAPSDANLDFDDDTLNAIAKVYTNRAAAHFCLGNYEETLSDATAAITLKPTFIQAIERGARACIKLKRHEEAKTWCDKGLAIDKNNKTLLDLRTKCVSEPDTSQETKRGNMNSMPVTHTAIGQSNNVMAESEVTSHSDVQLDFDDATLKAIATVYLEEGNKEYRRKEASNAVSFYTQGIQVNSKDDVLKAKLYSNRATAHFYLGNYQETLNDATAAVTLQPTFVKAIASGANACVKLKRYNEATTWCDKGLAIDKNNKTLMDLCNKCLSGPYTSQETMRKNTNSKPVTHTAIRQKKADSLTKPSKDEAGDKCGEGSSCGNISNAYQSLEDLRTAIDCHESRLEIAQEVGDKAAEEAANRNLGAVYFILGDFKTAIGYHERCLKIAQEVGDKVREGGAYGNLGNAYHCLGDFKTAIDYHERHLKLSKDVGDKGGVGIAYGNLGIAYDSLGDFKKAIDYYERVLKLAQQVGAKAGEGKAHGNLGIAYNNLGDFKRAIDHQKRCLKIAKEVGDKAGEGKAHGNLGNAYIALGDFKTAIECYECHLKIAKEVGEKAAEGGTYGNLGIAYDSLGDFKKAIEYHERFLKTAQEVGDKAREGKAYGYLGITYTNLGDYKRATDYHERCLKIAKEVGDKAGQGDAYGNLGNAYNELGDFKTAIAYCECHLKIAKEVGDKAGEELAYGNLGNAYNGLGDVKTAIDYFEGCLKIARVVGHKAGAAASFFNLGQSFALVGSIPKALDCFHSSVRMFNIVRHDLKGKDEWKISYRNMNKIAYTSLWRLLLKQGEVEKALFAADQGRAQALNDLMELNYGLGITCCQLHTRKESAFDSFSFLPSTAVFVAIDERDIVFWIVQNGKEVELRKKELPDDCSDFLKCLLEAASREIGVGADMKCEDRSLDKLENEQVANGRSPRTPHKPVPFHLHALSRFHDVIIDPIADLIHGNELILVPEGPLCLAPYAAFVDSNSKYLCDVCRIRVIPSLTSLKLISDSPAGHHSKTGVLLVGDPWVQEVVISGIILEQLPCARKEVQMIGRIFNSKPLTGREATKREVLRRLPTVALIHIAAHGRMETGEIALAPNTTRTSQIPANEDFLLTMKDVTSVQIRARLVVLSCCHSGRGEIKAEGVVGIARAFLGAGARAVLVSMWAIDDGATLEFMKSFYSYLVKGISASESLNKAMKHMRESDEFNEVKHWAPFVLIGDDVTLECGGSE